MRRLLLCLAILFLTPAIGVASGTCPQGQTVTYQDMMFGELKTVTAALVSPQGPVTGEVDATGCDIGVFYGVPGTKGLVQNAKIHGARLFGVLVNGTQGGLTVDVLSSSIYDIGDPTIIFYGPESSGTAVSYQAWGSSGTGGKVTGNSISRYQIVGIGVWGADVRIADNIISGLTPGWASESIGQWGIYVSGGKLSIERNTITDNVYTGPYEWWTGAGIIGQFSPGTQITQNVLVNNQNGIWIPSDAYAPTRLTVTDNRIMCNALYAQAGLQIGIWINGYRDKLSSNTVTGIGYDLATKPGYTFPSWVNELDPRGKPIK